MGVRKKTRDEYFDEGRIQRCLNGAISESATKYRMDGLYVFAWESDKLIITKSGYTYEFEVKISRSDFKADFKHKKDKHTILGSSITGEKYMPSFWEFFEANKKHYPTVQLWKEHCRKEGYCKTYFTEHYRRPNYFYYAVPQDLVSVDEIPPYAGLIYVTEYGSLRTVKKAPLLHKEKYTDEQLNLCEKFYYNMVSNKQNAENWQKRYNEAKAQLRAELEAKGQEMTYDGMKFRMEQSEFWKDHYEKECVRYEREMRYNVTERRLLIQEIRKYDPTFKVDGIEQEVMKIHGIK